MKICDLLITNLMFNAFTLLKNDAVSHCERVHVPTKQWFVDGLALNIRKRLAFNIARRGSIPEPLSNYRETCMHFIFILFSPGGRALATIDFRLYTCC